MQFLHFSVDQTDSLTFVSVTYSQDVPLCGATVLDTDPANNQHLDILRDLIHDHTSAVSWIQQETHFPNGVIRFRRRSNRSQADLLWLVMTYDKSSWGQVEDSLPRNISDLHKIIQHQYNSKRVSLGLLTSSREEYERYKQSIAQQDYQRVVIYFHPGFHKGQVVDREHRHDDEFQEVRRAEMSKLRNFLMLKAHREEHHIVWTDADVYHLDSGIVRRMIRHTKTAPGIGILTARCTEGANMNYDLNAWHGSRPGPDYTECVDGKCDEEHNDSQQQVLVDAVIQGSDNDDLLPLDTVGGTLLYMRGSLIPQGLSFPHQYTIGTAWGKKGWDGIESEGICYRARGLEGGGCAVLGGDWHTSHTGYSL
ncbi:Hypothetical protein D9617_9g023170 [Elsinoe fawcettii]|nr:Hypothetical protein D9617_9g023170 [Elsinoe fawcettii]